MTKYTFAEGDPVRVTSGAYAGMEGVVEDLQPECSAVRILTSTGRIYGLLGLIQKVGKPVRTPPKRNPIKK